MRLNNDIFFNILVIVQTVRTSFVSRNRKIAWQRMIRHSFMPGWSSTYTGSCIFFRVRPLSLLEHLQWCSVCGPTQ
jgi:hypothetical protein